MSKYYRVKTLMLKGQKGDTGYGISKVKMNDDYTLTITIENGMHFNTPPIRGEKGEQGTSIRSVELRDDYSLLITLDNGETLETTAILGKEFENIRTLEASATSASKIATSASTNASASAQSASEASISASESASNASTSASASAQSATNASQSATNAQESASSASTSADTATSKATEASASATKAKESETNAKSSETNASNSAKEANTSAVNAKASEDKAKEYADNLQNSTETISKLNDALVNQKKAISELSDKKITKFYAGNLGETHITDSDNGKIMDMLIYGKSWQLKTTGKNLFNKNDFTKLDNVYVDSNATLSNGSDNRGVVIKLAKGTYYYNQRAVNTDVQIAVFREPPKIGDVAEQITRCEINATVSKKIVLDDEKYIFIKYIYIYTALGLTPQAILDSIMITNNNSDTTYEPYTGGKPSPSPNYPQAINSVVNPTIKLRGANLLKLEFKEYENNGIILEVVGNKLRFHGTFTDTYTFFEVKNKPLVKKDTKVSLYVDNYNNHGAFAWLELLSNGNMDGLNKASPTDTLQEDKYLNAIGIENYNIGDTIDFTTTIAVLDNTNEYQPYTEQTLTLPITLNAVLVTTGGNVTIGGQQYIADYIDVERGKIVRRCEKATLNTNEGYADETYRLMFNLPSISGDGESKCLYSAFNWESWTTCVMGSKAYVKNIKKSDEEFYTAQELKDLNISFDIIYQLETPTEEDLTTEQVQALKALKTYYPTTNIKNTSEQLDGYTVFNYPISMANGWNYVKQQLNDNRDYIYDMDLQSAEAYVNSEYAVTLTELEV